jgi:hypothetical protein
MGFSREKHNVGGYYALAFWVKAEGEVGDELYVHLRDNPTYSYPNVTKGVPVVAEGLVRGGGLSNEEYRQVVVPIDRILRDSAEFRRDLVSWFVLSGDEREGRTYRVDNVRFLMDESDVAAEAEE